MAQLDGRYGTLGSDEVRNSAIGLHMVIIVESGTGVGLPSAFLDGRFLREDDAGTAHRELSQVDEVPIGGPARYRSVLAHWRDNDTVLKMNRAKAQRRKQQGRGRIDACLASVAHYPTSRF